MEYYDLENENRRPVRKKKSKAPVVFLIFVIIVLLGILTAGLVFYLKSLKEPKYEKVSLTEEVSAKAYVWLSNIEDMEVSFDEIRDAMGDISLDLVLTPTGERHMYSQEIIEGSYNECCIKADEGLKKAYALVLSNRLKKEGYLEEVDVNKAEELMKEAYGISLMEYFEKEEIELMPSEEDLKLKYNCEVER